MYLSILLLPLLGSIGSGFLGRKLGVTGSQFISCLCLGISSIFMTIAFYQVCLCGSPVEINLGSWIDSEFMTISWVFYFDQLTVMLGLAVLYCSTAIHIYSIYYLSSDPHIQRFFSYLSAFTFGMLVLITGGNFLVMFVGWEAIGVVSYLLINFYFTRIQANKAAILAFTMNRQGDMLMSIGFFAIFALFGTLNYSSVFSLTPYMNETAITIIALLLFGGACAKSAQIPLHSWLPGSMEAPTPVSALLHAANKIFLFFKLLLNFIIVYFLYYLQFVLHYISMPFFIVNNFVKKQNCFINFKLKYHTASIIKKNNGIKEEFIPWKLTSSGINALHTIKRFYNWVPKEHPIKLFINNHCLYLLKSEPTFLGQKDTSIPTSLYTVNSMLSNNKTLDCALLKTPEKAFDDIDSSYIYSFINKDNHRFYIGSSINPVTRLHNYIYSWTTSRQSLLREMRTTELEVVLIIITFFLDTKCLII
jgi:hypothetical protein